jgi:hypothetical protein
LLYLPPYSPYLNPIELAFSKLKGLLPDAAERTVEALWQTIGRLLGRFSPTECSNYIRHCGSAQSARQWSRGALDQNRQTRRQDGQKDPCRRVGPNALLFAGIARRLGALENGSQPKNRSLPVN